MAVTMEVIRTLTTRARTEGVDAARRELESFAKAQDGVLKSNDNAARSVLSAAKSFDALERSVDPVAKANARLSVEQAKVQRALNEGSVSAERAAKVLNLLGARHEAAIALTQRHAGVQQVFSSAMNDNARAAGLARHEIVNLGRQFADVGVSLAGGQSPFMVLVQQGSQIADVFGSSQAGAGGALRSFGALAARVLFSPVGAAAGLTAAVLGIKTAGDAAAESMAKLGDEARQSGLTPNRLTGAKIVGARAGLDDKETLGAFTNAQREFEQFSRNSGQVKDTIEKVDKGFLKVLDSARGSAEWIDKVNQEIRKLPTAQGLSLAKALFGDDVGRKLFEEIQRGGVSMASLSKEAENAGANFDASATHAEKMKREIAEADRIASTKLAATFSGLSNVSLDIDLAWARIKGRIAGMGDEIGEAWRKTQQIGAIADARRTLAPMLEDEPPEAAAMRKLGMRPDDPFARKRFEDVNPLINLFTEGKRPSDRAVGEDRALFEKPDKARLSAAAREADQYTKITSELRGQISLASSLGVEHDKVSLQLKIQAEQAKLGANASADHKTRVAELVTQLDAATRAQKRLNEETKAFNEAYSFVSNTLSSGIKDLAMRKGKPRDILQRSLEGIEGGVWDAALTGSGPFAKLFGAAGKDGATGGIFGSLQGGISDLLGIGNVAKDINTLNVQTIKVAGSIDGAGGKADIAGAGGIVGMFKNIFGGGGGQKYFSSPLFGGLKALWPFADGGIMTSGGALPLHRYESGGIANSAQLALFGEGRRPEAFVPLPDGKRIPAVVDMKGFGGAALLAAARGAGRWSGNDNRGAMQAAPVTVNLIGAPQGTKVQETRDSSGSRRIDVVMDERIAAGIGSPQGQEALASANGVARRVARR